MHYAGSECGGGRETKTSETTSKRRHDESSKNGGSVEDDVKAKVDAKVAKMFYDDDSNVKTFTTVTTLKTLIAMTKATW